jgi:hypothetical protein
MNNLENIVNFEFPENEYELFTLNNNTSDNIIKNITLNFDNNLVGIFWNYELPIINNSQSIKMVEIITNTIITKQLDYFSTITQFEHLKKINLDTYFYSLKNLNKIKMKFINFNYKINFIIVSNKLKNEQKI